MMNTETIDGQPPLKTTPFPKWPFYDDRELQSIEEAVKSQEWWRATGSKVQGFEENFSKYLGVPHCLAVTNGTHALELSMRALELGPGDEVIVPAITFVSTLSSILIAGAIPVVVDVNADDFCLKVDELEAVMTPRTKAIIPVHMAGHLCQMDAIASVADQRGLKVIEDAAHAHGAEWRGQKAGSFGDAAIFSFQNIKIMTSGEGGALVTKDSELMEKAFLIHGVGRPLGDRHYRHLTLGSNFRMGEFQGAVLTPQLERLDELNQKREKSAAKLDELLLEIEGLQPQQKQESVTIMTHYMYMFYYDESAFNGLSRDKFVEYLSAEGVPAFISYPRVSELEFFKRSSLADVGQGRLPNAEKIEKQVVWLPHFCLLGEDNDLLDIKEAILKIQRSACSQPKGSWD